jgi:hypothetical protein
VARFPLPTADSEVAYSLVALDLSPSGDFLCVSAHFLLDARTGDPKRVGYFRNLKSNTLPCVGEILHSSGDPLHLIDCSTGAVIHELALNYLTKSERTT